MKVPVLIPRIFNYPLTYNSNSSKSLKQGDLVQVKIGKSSEIGVVWDKIQITKRKFKIKNIENIVKKFKFNKNLIKFINWFSLYNLTPKGMVLKMCLGDQKNILNIEEKILTPKLNSKKIFLLNDEQKESLNDLKSFGAKFNVSVLQGVTGSGKTLVYFERIKEIIKNKKQVLILLPEIFLTNQFEERFIEYFGYPPAIWHSKISLKKKRKIWQGVIDGQIKTVIGARSSLFLPFKKLGLIILDEEHDNSYKQDEGLIYNARDMAISRAFFENIPIHLVSSVPSVETFDNIKSGKYNRTKLIHRYQNFNLPNAKIISLNLSNFKKNNYISDETLKLTKEYLDKNEQILFFLNRRGYSPFLICKNCGYKHTCPDCSIYLTYHKIKKKLICHYCGFKNQGNRKCDNKDQQCDFVMCGVGVEKILEELKIKFPKKNIQVFSSDFLKKKNESQNLLKMIEKNEVNILVGTQMISKGFNFPKLNCIVVVDADFSGKGYDLRTTEKNIQLYNQLSGRAGRFSKNSLIIYQTETPSNETLKDILANDPEKFLERELILRKQNRLPPYYRLISIIVSSNSEKLSFKGAQEIKNELKKENNFDILGPVDSPIFRVKRKYRTRLLIRTKKNNLIQKELVKFFEKKHISKKIKLTVDVDPINFT